jgi:NtrC-family two-component system sensor histidine kinase KinB
MLRTKVMLGLGGLLIILLSMGLYSIDRCSDLGQRIEKINRDHDDSGRNIGEMKRSCGAMTSALLMRVTGSDGESLAAFNKAWSDFEKALDSERTSQGDSSEEKKFIDQLSSTSASYVSRARAFLGTEGVPDEAGRAIAKKLGAETFEMVGLADSLGLAHEKGLSKSGDDVGASITQTVRLLFVLMIIACVVAIAASMGLTRGLLNPLASMSKSIQLVGEGNLDQKLPVLSRDELGMLATSFNRMATQLKQYRENTSEELLRLNMTIRATLASFPDPIFVLNSEGTVEFRNPEADQLAIQLLFAGVTRLPKKVDERVEHVRLTGQDFLPTLFQDAIKFQVDGQDRYFLPRIVVLRNDKKESFGVAVILENVTRMLLLDDVKSNLISTVSHELKTPLTSVRMALYLLVEKTVGPLNEKQHDLVITAREDADRLLRTLNDLLDLAKLEQGPALLDLQQVSPAKMVEAAVYAAREIAHSAEIELGTDVMAGLPDIRIDQQRIAYVFNNLITNALKYSPSGTAVLVRADLGQTRAALPSIRFSVKDKGPGISPEHQEHIFERFYRVPGTNKSGAGLGLSIAKEIVVAHGGEIGAICTPGDGCEFFFVLPIDAKPPSARNEII